VLEVLPAAGVSPTLDRFIQGYEGSDVFVNPVDMEVLASTKTVALIGWYVAAILPTTDAFAPIRDMQQRMLLATLTKLPVVGQTMLPLPIAHRTAR
jgi:hypothetical protein